MEDLGRKEKGAVFTTTAGSVVNFLGVDSSVTGMSLDMSSKSTAESDDPMPCKQEVFEDDMLSFKMYDQAAASTSLAGSSSRKAGNKVDQEMTANALGSSASLTNVNQTTLKGMTHLLPASYFFFFFLMRKAAVAGTRPCTNFRSLGNAA